MPSERSVVPSPGALGRGRAQLPASHEALDRRPDGLRASLPPSVPGVGGGRTLQGVVGTDPGFGTQRGARGLTASRGARVHQPGWLPVGPGCRPGTGHTDAWASPWAVAQTRHGLSLGYHLSCALLGTSASWPVPNTVTATLAPRLRDGRGGRAGRQGEEKACSRRGRHSVRITRGVLNRSLLLTGLLRRSTAGPLLCLQKRVTISP